MEITAQALAGLLNGTIEGDPSVKVTRPGKIESGVAGEVCFLGNENYETFAYTTEATILLVSNTFQPKQAVKPTLIRVANVYSALAFLLEKFSSQTQANGNISERASIHPSVILGKNVSIGDFTVLEEGVVVGDNTIIFPQVFMGKNAAIGADSLMYAGVKIYRDCKIGSQCIIHANVVIGADGFGFVPQADGTYKKIHHVGNVMIEDAVEIGANTTVDRASIGSTFIRRGVKLDNLVQIAHNVEIGENTVIAAQTGVSGSTKIGKNVRIGGQAGLGGHITIGDNAQIQGQSGVTGNQAEGVKLYGTPAFDFTSYLRSYSIFKKLPQIMKQIEALEKAIDEKGI